MFGDWLNPQSEAEIQCVGRNDGRVIGRDNMRVILVGTWIGVEEHRNTEHSPRVRVAVFGGG